MTPIAAAVQPLKAAAQDAAEEYALKVIERVLGELREVDMDADRVAPYPKWGSKREYAIAKGRYYLYRSFTAAAKCSRSFRDPDAQVRSPEREAKFVDAARADAASSFDAFVVKLDAKAGAHVSAELMGNSLWIYSDVRVTKADGTQERWQTKQILNVSKLGKVFNQWPTRRVK